MELNREQIIKGLECCANERYCGICKYRAVCTEIKKASLALIKELTEENERLRANAIECVEKIYRFMRRYMDKLSEIDEIDIAVRLGQIGKEMLEGEMK